MFKQAVLFMAHGQTVMGIDPEFLPTVAICSLHFPYWSITVSADRLSITQNATSLEEAWSLPLAWYRHSTTPLWKCAHAIMQHFYGLACVQSHVGEVMYMKLCTWNACEPLIWLAVIGTMYKGFCVLTVILGAWMVGIHCITYLPCNVKRHWQSSIEPPS